MTHNMKRWMITVTIMAVMLVAIGSTGSAAAPNYWGNKIGSFTYNGVEVGAYSNGYTSYVGPYGTYGYQFQCVEYVNRFYVQALGHKNMRGGGNANKYYSTASIKGLVAYRNGQSTTPPRMGDIICSNGGSYGHVAIVRQVLNDRIYVIHQNWVNVPGPASNNYYNQEANYKPLTLKKVNGKYTIGSFSSTYPVYGWLHKP